MAEKPLPPPSSTPQSMSAASSMANVPAAYAHPMPLLLRLTDRLRIDRHLVACVMCEMFCSWFLAYGGASINLVQIISKRYENNHPYGIAISWGLWLLLANYLGSQLSGPHMNPAFSLVFYWVGQIDFRRFLLYSIAQFVGWFVGSLMCFLVYYDAIEEYDGGVRQVYGENATASAFGTFPKPYLTVAGGFLDQLVTTAMLAMVVLAVTDERNNVPKGAQPGITGLGLWCIISMWSHNCGAALNPARDFSPRLMSLMVGYGWEVFSFNNYTWFWIPMIAPMFGGLLGIYVYNFFHGDLLVVNEKAFGGPGDADSHAGRRGTPSSIEKVYVPA